ncbi:hypothetical protein HYZ98_03145 [Candidatus Peregrinibacteria bacterium]|nr:hypothetical protein [Candidatus Peregrinibacteria bacterium]
MSDPESFNVSEGPGGASEELSEEARQRFSGASAAIAQIRKEEKRSKKRDTGIAGAIVQFLTDDQRKHLSTLIARLCSRNCPSVFLLALLSLINEECLRRVQEYLAEEGERSAEKTVEESIILTKKTRLDSETNRILIQWLTRIQLVLSIDGKVILSAILLDEKNMDGTVLQLTAFILEGYLQSRGIKVPFERSQALAMHMLHAIFEPFLKNRATA